MRTGGEHPTAEHAALALYLLGALDDADRVAFEAHLAGCDECLSAAGEMGGVTSALGGLDAADWDDLAGLTPEFPLPPEFGPPPDRAQAPATPPPVDPLSGGPPSVDPPPPTGSGEPATPVPVARPPADEPAAPVPVARPPADSLPTSPTADGGPVTADGPAPAVDAEPLTEVPPVAAPRRGARRGAGPRTTGRGAGSRPGGDRPATASGTGGTRPADPSRRRRMVLWGGVAAALVAVVLAGGIAVVSGFGDRSGVVLTATGEAPAEGVSLSVAITTDEGRGSTIRITATGLRQGLRYRLFAVTRDGVTHVVRDWTASTGPQEVTGELSLPVADLAFVTVGLVDGTAIVTAPISR
ncbi:MULTISPECIES: zf-HC2 domain-containing protein [unclassified Micromonospora]|uniref:zf-HC2 domain-containing protein n=1 Tax=unclassified Micromonospora TaxID=2617518 RepID=UPI00143DF966|nr:MULTISPECIES: zf-HC2 domain-containing protein [unclassified Micromonospora]